MDAKLFSFIAGAFSSLCWTGLPSISFILLLLILLCVLFTTKHSLGCLFLLGVIWMASVGHWQGALQLPSSQTSQAIFVEGKITDVIVSNQNPRFNFKVSKINDQILRFTRTIRLSWRLPPWKLQQGQRLALQVKLKPPHGLANQGGFHYQQWLFSQGVVATGYVKSYSGNQLLESSVSIRQSLLNQMLAFDLKNAKWLAALTFGYRGLLDSDDWWLVQKTGVAHLIAISGLHLALVASLSYLLITWGVGGLVSQFHQLHWLNLHNVAVLLTVLTTLTYSGLAGFGLPTLRAWIMLLLFSGLFISNQTLSPKRFILLGITSFVLFFPLSLFGQSFWLSFSAVIFIGLTFWRWPVKRHGFSLLGMLSAMLKLQLGLTLLMMPLVAWQFSYISLISPLVNLLAVPVVTILLVPLCLAAAICLLFAPSWANVLFSFADKVTDYGLTLLHEALHIKGAYFNIQALPIWVWIWMFFCLCLAMLPKFWWSKIYLPLLLLPLLTYCFSGRDNHWQVDILDVGQGVAVLISKGNKAIIYDVGASYPSGFNMADGVLLPILQAKGISKVDKVIISHGDNDHAGSLPQLLNGVELGSVLTNQDSCKQGTGLDWQGLYIEAFWPDDASQYNDNNGSCVIKITGSNYSVLFPGDIDKSIESRLVAKFGRRLQSDILLAPHHGSNTSSSDLFIKTVSPKYVVFSQGFMNRWGFPRDEVLQRYQRYVLEAQLFSTSESGQVSFVIPDNSSMPIKVKTFRRDRHPYWYANGY